MQVPCYLTILDSYFIFYISLIITLISGMASINETRAFGPAITVQHNFKTETDKKLRKVPQ